MTIQDRAVAARRLVRLLQAAVRDAEIDEELAEALVEHLAEVWAQLDMIAEAPGAQTSPAPDR